jgi:hypothetical protein
MFIAALFTTVKLWKQSRHPTTDEWIKEMWYLCTVEFYSATRQMKFCYSQVKAWNWEVILSEVSQAQKAKCHMFSLICRI